MSTDRRSNCPLAVCLDLLGDRWTLLVLRDLFVGKRRFAEFRESPERIASNILSDRLKRLECAGLIEKRPRTGYHLTRCGADTLPILQAAVRWSRTHFPEVWAAPPGFEEMTPEQWWQRTGSLL